MYNHSLLIRGRNHFVLLIARSKVRKRVSEEVTHGGQKDKGGVPVPRRPHRRCSYFHPNDPSLENLLVHGVQNLLFLLLFESGQSDDFDLFLGADHGQVRGTIVRFRYQLSLDRVKSCCVCVGGGGREGIVCVI